MYSAPRHLARVPFDPASSAPAIFVADSHRAPLSALLRGVLNRDPFITIIGEAGVGKTTLVNGAVLDPASARVRIIRVCNPHGRNLSLSELLAQVIGKDRTDSLTGDDANRVLAVLTTAQGDERRVVLIVDDAHSLAAEALQYLLRASDVARSQAVSLQVIFVGRPAFREVLRQQDPEGRITISAVVEPLSGAEARDYIRRYLSFAGISAETILSEAMLMDSGDAVGRGSRPDQRASGKRSHPRIQPRRHRGHAGAGCRNVALRSALAAAISAAVAPDRAACGSRRAANCPGRHGGCGHRRRKLPRPSPAITVARAPGGSSRDPPRSHTGTGRRGLVRDLDIGTVRTRPPCDRNCRGSRREARDPTRRIAQPCFISRPPCGRRIRLSSGGDPRSRHVDD